MLQEYIVSSNYPWKCTNKEKLISLYVTNCECGKWLDAHVTLDAEVSGSISGDTHYYTLSPPFLQKHIRKRGKKSYKKKKPFELRDDLIPFEGT